ncbi:MAG: hypothetical protein BWX98_02006 [Candidatus Aminicenantes bacterium ADurb.Bin147]|nr:MAG: hypothetical protein BWX98_02006 [Candidatus Aminicenantes bacterium ADurb.Bin147]
MPAANRATAPRATWRSVSQPRTIAPLTGVAWVSTPCRKSKTSLSMLAAAWRITIAANAPPNRRMFKDAPPATTARLVPKITGIVEAGNAQGRAAVTHLRPIEGGF